MTTATATNPPPAAPAFFRMNELAAYLGISPRSIRRAMLSHRLPYTKLGGATLFRRVDVEKCLEAATVPAHSMQSRKTRKAV